VGLGGTAGGFAGYNEFGTISKSYATGNVSGGQTGGILGGFVGYDDGGGTISQSYATGNVSGGGGSTELGGFVGEVGGDTGNGKTALIENAYATGAVTAGKNTNAAGGFVGTDEGLNTQTMIVNAYATGAISFKSGTTAGGFAGASYSKVSHCYWDIDTTGMKTSSEGEGVTTAQLQDGLLPGLKSSVWALDPNINNGFPYLIALASSY
jgi:The GLUG motif